MIPLKEAPKFTKWYLWIHSDWPLGAWVQLPNGGHSPWSRFSIGDLVDTIWSVTVTGRLPEGQRDIPIENLLKAWSSTAVAKMHKSEIASEGPLNQFAILDANQRNTRSVPNFDVSIEHQSCPRCGADVVGQDFHDAFIYPIYTCIAILVEHAG